MYWKRFADRLDTLRRDAIAPPARALRAGVGLARDTRGAVMVEFLAVFFPILTMFLSLVQLSFLFTASIVVQHTAMKAVRVASVVLYDNPAFYGGDEQGIVTDKRLDPVRDIVNAHVGALGDPADSKVNLDKAAYSPNEMIDLTVEYDYKCNVPLGNVLACGFSRTRKLVGKAALPNQGAEFIY